MFGQTDIQMSQHMLNRTTYNPASTGASRYINIYGHWRDQWVGFPDAPTTIFLTAHGYFSEMKSGFGIIALKDNVGYEDNLMFKLAYAYHIHFSSNSYLSLGLNGGILNRRIDWRKAVTAERDEGTIPTELESKLRADFDFGIEYNMERFTVGLSATHINHTADEAKNGDMGHHFYGYLKYIFSLNFDFDLVPSLFAQNSKKSTHLELSTLLYYRNRAWIGGGYRCDEKFDSESVVGILGIDLSNKFRLSYSFDYNIGKIGNKDVSTRNTHEVMLGIRLARPMNVYAKTPRFFE